MSGRGKGSRGDGETKPPKVSGGEVFHKEMDHVKFPSPNDTFRVHIATAEGVQIWCENKRTRLQWQVTVTDAGEHGPKGDMILLSHLKCE